MKVRVKKLDEKAVIPAYAKEGDAGLDLTAVRITKEAYSYNPEGLSDEDRFWGIGNPETITIYHTGLAFEIPMGYVGLLIPRSSVSNRSQILANCVGVLDSGYRGEVLFKFKDTEMNLNKYRIGERIGQLLILPYPAIQLEEAKELDDTERGTGGFGSSGN